MPEKDKGYFMALWILFAIVNVFQTEKKSEDRGPQVQTKLNSGCLDSKAPFSNYSSALKSIAVKDVLLRQPLEPMSVSPGILLTHNSGNTIKCTDWEGLEMYNFLTNVEKKVAKFYSCMQANAFLKWTECWQLCHREPYKADSET